MRFRHADNHEGVCVQNFVAPLSTWRTTPQSAVAARLRSAARSVSSEMPGTQKPSARATSQSSKRAYPSSRAVLVERVAGGRAQLGSGLGCAPDSAAAAAAVSASVFISSSPPASRVDAGSAVSPSS